MGDHAFPIDTDGMHCSYAFDVVAGMPDATDSVLAQLPVVAMRTMTSASHLNCSSRRRASASSGSGGSDAQTRIVFNPRFRTISPAVSVMASDQTEDA
ncbi:MAG: hypothetical protein CMI50_00010 [Paracoccus sp.]|nr:hypothetical protein [Paracoccus sp. (in: a-proteobacteria)]MBA47554.1 hypothetical protein [Paracoccus sp. (in: a-proteobacteria)]